MVEGGGILQLTVISRVSQSVCRLEYRHLIVLCLFLATFCAYVERTGFSIAYTALAKESAVSEKVKGTVMSSFFWGYAISQFPGGIMAQRHGGRKMLLICFSLWSTAVLLTPHDARNTGFLVLARVSVGIAQGFLIPAVHTIISQWIPPHERAVFTSIATSGMYLGSSFAIWILPDFGRNYGAGTILQFLGILGYCWLVFWFFFGKEVRHREQGIPTHSSTQNSSKVSKSSNNNNNNNSNILGQSLYNLLQKQEENSNKSSIDSNGHGHGGNRTPYQEMLRSTAVWVIVLNNFTFHYAFYMVMNWLPTYFAQLIRKDLSALSSLKIIPYIVMFLSCNFGGWLGDYLIRPMSNTSRSRYSTAQARKLVNSVGFWCAAISLVLMPGAKSVRSGLFFTTLTLGFLGFARGGFSVNHMDIAPRYAGIVMGFSNTAGTLSGVIGVAVTGHLLDLGGGSSHPYGWYVAHMLAAGMCLAGALMFAKYGKGVRIFH